MHLYIHSGPHLGPINSYASIGQVLQKAPNLSMLTVDEGYQDHEMPEYLQSFMSQIRSNPNQSCALSLEWRFYLHYGSEDMHYQQVDCVVSAMGGISGIDTITFELGPGVDFGLQVL
ncbi:hypothetical protein BDZ97DRAFT_1926374 [Flammula alnicola]|nr:hypothetical protein BDZ97DRAFT_1926374 [Flammula alnicola]